MVEWLAGGRIRGTNAERTTTTGIGNEVGGWVELGRTTLGSASDAVDVTSLADKRYLMVLGSMLPSGTIQTRVRENSNSGSVYAHRFSINGGADGALASQAGVFLHNADAAVPNFSVGYCANLSTKEKLNLTHYVGQSTAGAGTAPLRSENAWKLADTTNPIDAINYYNAQTGDFDTGSEVVVLGWDPADTHTTNFWEELGSDTLTSAGNNLTTGTITAKKYLWIQTMSLGTGNVNGRITFNDDTTTYAERYSLNGAADPTPSVSRADIFVHPTGGAGEVNVFTNMFVINNSANEKLVIGHSVAQSTATAGYVPNRSEFVAKWDNVSTQITKIDFDNAETGSYGIGTTLKVWGHD